MVSIVNKTKLGSVQQALRLYNYKTNFVGLRRPVLEWTICYFLLYIVDIMQTCLCVDKCTKGI